MEPTRRDMPRLSNSSTMILALDAALVFVLLCPMFGAARLHVRLQITSYE